MSANRVRDKPKIVISHSESTTATASESTHGTTPPPNPITPTYQDGHFFDCGDLLVQGLWEKNTACVLDIRVTDTDQPAYRGSTPEQVVAAQERTKKKPYQARCLKNRTHFVPYVCCASGLLEREAKAYTKRITTILAEKWHSPYSVTYGYVNARMSVAILRATHICIRGSRVPFRHARSKLSQ